MFNIYYNIHIIRYMSIKADIVPSVPLWEEKKEFSRSGTDTACINCQCGYKDVFETDDTSRPRSLKKLIRPDITYLKLQKICDEFWIVIDCDGVQDPSLSGDTGFVCFHTRQRIIDLVKKYRASFQSSHADDLADIW